MDLAADGLWQKRQTAGLQRVRAGKLLNRNGLISEQLLVSANCELWHGPREQGTVRGKK